MPAGRAANELSINLTSVKVTSSAFTRLNRSAGCLPPLPFEALPFEGAGELLSSLCHLRPGVEGPELDSEVEVEATGAEEGVGGATGEVLAFLAGGATSFFSFFFSESESESESESLEDDESDEEESDDEEEDEEEEEEAALRFLLFVEGAETATGAGLGFLA